MASPWSSFLPDVLPHAPGCPVPVAEHELKRAAQRFFAGSYAWKITVAPVAVAEDQAEVTVSTGDSSMAVVRVENAWYDGIPLDVYSSIDMANDFGDDWQTHTGTPQAIIQDVPGEVRLYPVPNVAAMTGLKLHLSVKPSESATGIPDDLAERHRDALVAGAKSKLMLYPKTEWYDPAIAGVAGADFEIMMSRAAIHAARSYGRGRIKSRQRWF